MEAAVDFDALVALLHELGELLAVLALAAAHHGRQQIKPRALRERHDAVDHLRHGLALDRQAGGGRVGHADARPQQPHVVVDLGDGADRRARIARGGLLLDGDRRRQAVDLVDVRLLHHFRGIAAHRPTATFDVAALTLGIDGVEGERGFAGAGQAGEHHQAVARGMSRSMSLRLCSRAPRIVIARVPEPAVVWRLALITSSMSAFPAGAPAAHILRALPPHIQGEGTPMGELGT